MMYHLSKPRSDMSSLFAKLTLMGIGLIIGASIGAYFVLETIPYPNQEVIYIRSK